MIYFFVLQLFQFLYFVCKNKIAWLELLYVIVNFITGYDFLEKSRCFGIANFFHVACKVKAFPVTNKMRNWQH